MALAQRLAQRLTYLIITDIYIYICVCVCMYIHIHISICVDVYMYYIYTHIFSDKCVCRYSASIVLLLEFCRAEDQWSVASFFSAISTDLSISVSGACVACRARHYRLQAFTLHSRRYAESGRLRAGGRDPADSKKPAMAHYS